MKTTISNFRHWMMALSAVLVISCSAEDGEDGAIGPQGPQGIQGEAGQDGQNGADGNANVVASDWIASAFPTEASSYTTFQINDNSITEEIIETGVVLAFGRQGGGVWSLPDSYDNHTYSFFLNTGTIDFEAYTLDFSEDQFDRYIEFRYVLIPVSNSSSGKIAKTDYSKMTYY